MKSNKTDAECVGCRKKMKVKPYNPNHVIHYFCRTCGHKFEKDPRFRRLMNKKMDEDMEKILSGFSN